LTTRFTAALLQIDWDAWRPENIFGVQVLERTPAGLTVLYLIGMAILVGLIFIAYLSESSTFKFRFELALPKKAARRLARAAADRSVQFWQIFFSILAVAVFGFHAYWVFFADNSNEQYQALAYKDLRNRRTSAADLRGWMLDRTGKLENALAYYRVGKDGSLSRAFGLDKELAHLLGTERGTPGLERTMYKRSTDPMPESWSVLTRIKRPEEERKDVRTTLDRELQAFVAQQLAGRSGAIVVLDPQNGDVLAIYSNPSYSLSEAQSLDDYLKLEGNTRDKPLLKRATREFYVPGSTFKTFTAIAAFRAGKQGSRFPSFADGFKPTRSSRPIVDSSQNLASDGSVSGACAGGCQEKDMTFAYKVSSNQYFAQLAIDLGRERIRETAEAFGIFAAETPSEALQQRFFPSIWNTGTPAIANSLAPQQSSIVTGKDISLFDIGIEGIGQGYAGQITPFQMALIAAAVGNMEGKLMRPRIEADIQPQVFGQILSPQQAAAMREIMSTVTEEPGGTGTVISSKLAGTGIRTGGKTGTAEKLAPVYDSNGKLRTETKKRKNDAGEIEEYKVPIMAKRSDSWFISIAPLERPRVAIAVVVEGGGYGSRTAAPIAANVILKARDRGLLGENYKAREAPAPKQPARRQRPQ
jgi:penicillin-binding protein A